MIFKQTKLIIIRIQKQSGGGTQGMSNKENKLAKETIRSFHRVNDSLWTLVYKNDYALDALLECGTDSIMSTVKHLQNTVRASRLAPNSDKDGFACSTFNARNENGDPIFARNFDYKEAPCVAVWTAPENGYRSMAVIDSTFFIYGTKIFKMKNARNPKRLLGAPYMSMDGINEKGFSCAVLEIKAKATKQNTGKKPINTTVALRAALDKCSSVEEALDLFTSYDMHDLLGLSYHYQFADAAGNSAILEYVDNKPYIIRQKVPDENLKLTNYFLTPGGDNSDGRGEDRFEHIGNVLKKNNGVLSENDAMKLLSECTLNYRHKTLKHLVITLWSAVYNCRENSMLLCTGMDYGKKYRLYLDKPGEVFTVE